MSAFQFRDVFSGSSLGGAVIMALEYDHLTAASFENGNILTFDLSKSAAPKMVEQFTWGGAIYDHPPTHIVQLTDETTWLWSHLDGRVLPMGLDSVLELDGEPLKISTVVGIAGDRYVVGFHNQGHLD